MAEILVGDVLARLRADSAQFTQTLQRAIQQLGQLNQAFTSLRHQQHTSQQQLTQQTQALHQLAQSATQATTAVTRMGSGLQSVLAVAGGIGLANLASQLRAVVVESVRLSGQMQDLHIAFRAIEGSSGAANTTLARLFDTAQRLGVEFTSITDGFKRMEQAAKGTSLQGETIRQVFEGVLQGSRQLGLSSQNLSRALVALEQILTKNRASAEELNQQLGDAVPGGVGMLAQALGMTTSTFQEMIQVGLVPAESAVIAFGKAMQDVGRDATGPLERITSVFAQLKNETTAWMTALGDSLNSVLAPFLRDLIQVSEELRRIFGIRPPGTQATPGASTFGLGPLTPRTIGTMPANPYMPSEFETAPTGRAFASSQFDALIRREAARIAFDPALFSQLVRRESGFKPTAVSPAGAAGLGQLMPETGREFGLKTLQDFYDPEKNLTAAANVLQQYRKIIQDKFGTLADETEILLAAYNAGIGNVIKAIEETQRVGEQVNIAQVIGRLPKPQETGPYVRAIMGTTAQATAPAATGAALDPFAPMLKTATETTEVLTKIQARMDLLAESGLNFGGILDDALTKQADEAVKKFTQMAQTLAAFPELLRQMTPAQKEQLQLAAQQVAAIQARVELDKSSAGEARARVQVLRQFEEQLAREQAQDQQQYQAAIDTVTMSLARQEDQALKTLATLNAQFFQRREERALDTVAAIQAQFPYNEVIQAQAAQAQASLEARDAYNLEVEALKERFLALKQNADAMREQEATTEKFTQDVGERLAALQTPRDERLSAQFRRRAEREDVDLTPQLQAQLRLIDEQMRWNTLMDHAGRIGDQAAQTITNGLMRMADGTVAVSEGFRAMAKDILDSMAQIALNETFKALFGLGLGLLSGAVTGGATGGTAGFGGNTGYGLLTPVRQGAEGLGPINKPTLALIGEGSTNPEYVLNQGQINQMMSSAMRSGPGAGGQAAGGISIINVSSREQARATAAQEEAMGRRVVLNYVADELSQGSGSRIGQLIKTIQR